MGSHWRSPDGEQNALAIRAQFEAGFGAIAEYDRIGHLLLHRAATGGKADTLEAVVGVAMLRRAVTLFTGIRTLLEHSHADVARAPARAYIELWLQHRCMAYGGLPIVYLDTPTSAEEREPRAARYHVAAERQSLRLRAIVLAEHMKDETEEQIVALEREAANELARLRTSYPLEWQYFGDATDVHILTEYRDPAWFTPDFPDQSVTTIRQLAKAFGHVKLYDLLYHAFSALMHSRGTGHDLTLSESQADVHSPHDPRWFQTIAWMVLAWHQTLLMTAAKWHAPVMIGQLKELIQREAPGVASLAPSEFPNLLA